MAQELHDGVGHGLAVIAMQAGVALHVLDKDPAEARASLEAIRDTSQGVAGRAAVPSWPGPAPGSRRATAPLGLADLAGAGRPGARGRAATSTVDRSTRPGARNRWTGGVPSCRSR